MEQEIWKEIKGYQGIYEVSNFGKIKSLSRKSKNNRTKLTKIMVFKIGTSGYYHIGLTDSNGNRKNFDIHRIVATHFIENKLKKLEVNHIDGNKKNNHFSNLEWCTRSENSLHAYKIGLQNPTKYWLGKCGANHHASIKVKCVEDNLLFDSINEASIYYNTQRCSISLVCKGKLKTTAKKHFIYQ